MLREEFRRYVRIALEEQDVSLPIQGELSLSLTVEIDPQDGYRLDLDNLLSGVMSSLDDKPFIKPNYQLFGPALRLLPDDRQITSVHILLA